LLQLLLHATPVHEGHRLIELALRDGASQRGVHGEGLPVRRDADALTLLDRLAHVLLRTVDVVRPLAAGKVDPLADLLLVPPLLARLLRPGDLRRQVVRHGALELLQHVSPLAAGRTLSQFATRRSERVTDLVTPLLLGATAKKAQGGADMLVEQAHRL